MEEEEGHHFCHVHHFFLLIFSPEAIQGQRTISQPTKTCCKLTEHPRNVFQANVAKFAQDEKDEILWVRTLGEYTKGL